MSHVFPRHCHSDLPTAVAGDGCYLIDSNGKRYFDGSGGAAVSCLGHSNTRVRDAIKEQVDKLAFAHTGFLTTEPAEALADLLIANAPGDLDRVYFVSGGSEAVESAIKLARQFHLENGEPERRHLIARRQSYHGNTLGALSAGGNAWRRQQFAPLLVEMSHIAPCYEYAERGDSESLPDYGQRAAQELEDEILRLGPETVMAFIAEPVVGATLGAVIPAPGYFARIREICDKYGVLLILDEVMCGMGRTGTLHACEQEGVSPDLMAIAKGLGAGYQPIGAVLAQTKLVDVFRKGSGMFQHGHTYLGHPMACAAALAVQQVIERDGLLAQVQARGQCLEDTLQAQFGTHQHVGDIRGRGLFWGIELVEDRATKQWFDPAQRLHAKIKSEAMKRGLMVYPMGGTLDGKRGDHVLLAPPFISTEAEVVEIVSRLHESVNAAIGLSRVN
jgi:adenosylmethionine-8-amino-7-oxononanoate aminotransferase